MSRKYRKSSTFNHISESMFHLQQQGSNSEADIHTHTHNHTYTRKRAYVYYRSTIYLMFDLHAQKPFDDLFVCVKAFLCHRNSGMKDNIDRYQLSHFYRFFALILSEQILYGERESARLWGPWGLMHHEEVNIT